LFERKSGDVTSENHDVFNKTGFDYTKQFCVKQFLLHTGFEIKSLPFLCQIPCYWFL